MNSKLLCLADGLQLLKKYDDGTDIRSWEFGIEVKILHTKISNQDNESLKNLGWYYNGEGWVFSV